MGATEIANFASAFMNFCKLAVSGLEIGVQERPLGEMDLEYPEGTPLDPEDGIRFLPPMALKAKLKEPWQVDGWQWQRSNGDDWKDIQGQKADSYTVVEADCGNQLRVIASVAYGKIASDPVQVDEALILSGGSIDGVLTASVKGANLVQASFDPNLFQFVWAKLPAGMPDVEDSWKPADFATRAAEPDQYESSVGPLCLADVGAKFRVTATYKKDNKDCSLTNDRVIRPLTIEPAICSDGSGKSPFTTTAKIGDELYVSEGTGGAPERFAYSWSLKDTPATTLAKGRSYIVAPTCAGQAIIVRAQYTDGSGASTAPKEASAVTVAVPSVTITSTTVTPSGAAKLGQELTATVNNVTGRGLDAMKGYSIRYQWYNTENSGGELALTKTYTPDKAGQYQVKVTFQDNANRGDRVDAEYTSAIISVSV